MKKYKIQVIKNFLPSDTPFNYNRIWLQEKHIADYWKEIGGIKPQLDMTYLHIIGTDRVLAEFILTYPYISYLKIQEVNLI